MKDALVPVKAAALVAATLLVLGLGHVDDHAGCCPCGSSRLRWKHCCPDADDDARP